MTSKAPSGSPSRVLVVDDEENVLVTTSAVLRDQGYDVEGVKSGEEAIARIRANDYDVVLTDLALHDRDGLEILGVLRDRSDAVGIVLTGYASLNSAIEAVRSGAFDYLTKPCDIDELIRVVEAAACSRRERHAAERRVREALGLATTTEREVVTAVEELEKARRAAADGGALGAAVDRALERLGRLRKELADHRDRHETDSR